MYSISISYQLDLGGSVGKGVSDFQTFNLPFFRQTQGYAQVPATPYIL